MNAVPIGWQSVSIGQIADIVSGGTPPSKDERCFAQPGNGIPWLTPADLSGYKHQTISHGSRDLSEFGLQSCSAKQMPAGTVLFSSRAPIGYVAIAANPICTNQGFKSFVFPSPIDSRFAYYQLKHIKPIAEAVATGTTFKELSGSAASKLPFAIAPAAEQKRIADKLDTVLTRVDAVNTRLARVAPLLKRFRQSVLAAATSGRLTEDWRSSKAQDSIETLLDTKQFEFLTSAVQIPSTWKIRTLGQISERIQDGNYGAEYPTDQEWTITGVPFLTGTALGDGGQILREKMRYVSIEKHRSLVKAQIHSGDIVFPNRGARDSQKNGLEPISYLIPEWMTEGNINPQLTLVRTNQTVCNRYIKVCIDSAFFLAQHKLATSGSALAFINLTKTKAIALPIPPIEEQLELVRRIETLFAFADRLEARLALAQAAATRLTPALLAKAFRGELVPQDPNDETAAELLRRLSDKPIAVAKSGRTKKVI